MKIDSSKAEKLKSFISEATFTEIENIKNETLLFEEGLFDSLGFLSLISFIEEEFGIEVGDDELNETNFESILAIEKYITKKESK